MNLRQTPASTWTEEIARFLLDASRNPLPDDVLERAAIQTFDALACAAGAVDAELVQIVRRVAAGSGPAQASVFFSGDRASVLDAILVNGTAVRYLDFNDSFINSGPGGHPSDNIAVALAVGEYAGSTGREVLTAIALGYELYWRFRQEVYARSEDADSWDGVSVSGLVASGMAGLLLGLDENRLTHALAVGSATGYALKQLRRGSISMVKGCANALVARDGVLAAQLAAHGLTGPREIFEGRSGLLRAFGLQPTAEALASLSRPPDWAIRNCAIKPFPAIGTSQAAIHAAITISRDVDVAEIEQVLVRLPDTPTTHEHLSIEQRQRPDSRESADHSIPFLVACALQDGDLSFDQFEGVRWTQPRTLTLMERVTIVPDPALVRPDLRCYPAVVQVVTRDGRQFEETVMATPGSPDAPWGLDEVARKFVKTQRVGYGQAEIDDVMQLVRDLPEASDLSSLLAAVTQPTKGHR